MRLAVEYMRIYQGQKNWPSVVAGEPLRQVETSDLIHIDHVGRDEGQIPRGFEYIL
jgi:hypothetical protein